MVRLHLESRGQKYDERDVDADAAARQELIELGGSGTPVTVIDGEVVIGFDEESIDELLGFTPYNDAGSARRRPARRAVASGRGRAAPNRHAYTREFIRVTHARVTMELQPTFQRRIIDVFGEDGRHWLDGTAADHRRLLAPLAIASSNRRSISRTTTPHRRCAMTARGSC